MNKFLKVDELLIYQKIALGLSAFVLLVCLGAVIYQGGLLYGIEFTGGLNVEFEFSRPIEPSTVQNIRESLKEGVSSVQVNTFSLERENQRRGLMITVRARQLVNALTEDLYQRGQTGSDNVFEEVAAQPEIRWIDAKILRENFRLGEGESGQINISSASRDEIRARVQSIVNQTLIDEVVAHLRQVQGGESDRFDMNWASPTEIVKFLRNNQASSLAKRIRNTLDQQTVNKIADLEPILSDYNLRPQQVSDVFSIGDPNRNQVDLTGLTRESLQQILFEEFFQNRYKTVAQEINKAREKEGLFTSPKQFYNLDVIDSLYRPALKQAVSFSPFVLIRSEMVSPSIGSELIGKSALAIFISLFGILLYLYIRFELTYSLGAIIAIIHDVAITIGLLTLLQVEFDVSVVAAVLTVIGYSLNDTIVNFDRVRENRTLMGYKASWYDVINRSVYEVLNRTLVTSITTFLAVLVLLLYGGIALQAFAVTLIIGVVVGTYSSIFVSNLSLYHLQKSLRGT